MSIGKLKARRDLHLCGQMYKPAQKDEYVDKTSLFISPFQKNPCKCFVETATSYPEPPHLVPEAPHLVTKPPHLTTKAKLNNILGFL